MPIMTLSVWFHENKSTSMADAGAREMKKKGKEKGKESALVMVNVKNR